MADDDLILGAFRGELVDAGLVRRASDDPAAFPGLPPVHNEPIEGPPAPGEVEGKGNDPELILTLKLSGDLSELPFDAAVQRRAVLDVVYRSATASALRRAMTLDAAIRNRLIRSATNYGFGFILDPGGHGLFCHEAAVWGGFSEVSRSRATGYRHVAKWLIVTAP